METNYFLNVYKGNQIEEFVTYILFAIVCDIDRLGCVRRQQSRKLSEIRKSNYLY